MCGTNFNLVNSYCAYIINHTNRNYSIEAILDLKLNYYIFYGKKYNLSKEELEKIDVYKRQDMITLDDKKKFLQKNFKEIVVDPQSKRIEKIIFY